MDSDAILFEQIEKKHAFRLPDEFKQLSREGRFRFDGLPGTHFGDLLHARYMWFNDMEWSTLPEILDSRFITPAKPGFVRFAFTGGGDSWCWYTRAITGQKTPVVMCPRDCQVAQFYAEDFIGALYRHALEFCACGIDDEKVARQYLARWSSDLDSLFPEKWKQTIDQLSVAPLKAFKSWKGDSFRLLDREECVDLVKRDLSFDRLNEEIIWMED